MKKTHFFVKHWVAAFAIAVLTIVIGVVSLTTLSVEQYPDIAPPMVTIQATYSGADAHAVMESVIMPLEEVVNGVENMIYMDATATSNGEGEIDIYFKQGTDADNGERAEPCEPGFGRIARGCYPNWSYRREERQCHVDDYESGKHRRAVRPVVHLQLP